jgi:hypothetical protein
MQKTWNITGMETLNQRHHSERQLNSSLQRKLTHRRQKTMSVPEKFCVKGTCGKRQFEAPSLQYPNFPPPAPYTVLYCTLYSIYLVSGRWVNTSEYNDCYRGHTNLVQHFAYREIHIGARALLNI